MNPTSQPLPAPGRPWAKTLLLFCLSFAVGLVLVGMSERIRIEHLRHDLIEATTDQGSQIQQHLNRGLSATYALAALVRQGNGKIDDFEQVASQILAFTGEVGSLQLAPNGVVQKIAPLAGNEKAIGHDVLKDEQHAAEARLALKTRQLTLAGPFKLSQGGHGVVGHLPVFLSLAGGKTRFWGFANVVINIDDLLKEVSTQRLSDKGYRFALWRKNQETGQPEVFAGSGPGPSSGAHHFFLSSPLHGHDFSFDVPNGEWTLSLEPANTWYDYPGLLGKLAAALLASLLISFAGHLLFRQPLLLRREVETRTRELEHVRDAAESDRQAMAEAKAEAQADREMFRLILDSTAEGIYGIDLNGCCTFSNKAGLQLLGYASHEELQGRDMHALIHHTLPGGDPFPVEDCRIFQAFQRGKGTHVVDEYLWRKDGSGFPAEYWSYPIIFNHQITGAVVTFIDISERKKTEQSLLAFKAIVDSTDDAITSKTLDGIITSWNAGAERIFGYGAEEIIGRSMHLLIPEDRVNDETAILESIARGERVDHFETVRQNKDGQLIDISITVSPLIDQDGRLFGASSIARDISERKRLDAALQEAAAKFQAVYETISDAILIQDTQTGQILDVNASACQLYGHTRDELLTLHVEQLSANGTPYVSDSVKSYLQTANQGGWITFEWQAKTRSGREFWVEVTLKPFQLAGKRLALAVVRDIDQQKTASEALNRALAEAVALNKKLEEAHLHLLQSEKMASIGQLAAGVAHELNNPIGFVSSNMGTLEAYLQEVFAVISAYEAAEADTGAQQAGKAAVHALKQQADFEFLRTDIFSLMQESREGLARVTQIVADLKAFSHVGEAGFQWADVHKGLDLTLNIVRNELKYKCNLIKKYGDLPPVFCNPSQLNQVFLNLLVNAAHAIPERGDITLSTGRQGDEVFIAVSDTGTGIAPEHLKRIFDPFFTTKPVGKGTGLGLSLSYGIVESHHGRLQVESELGRGTTFTVWLPIGTEPQDVEPTPAAATNPSAPGQASL